MLFVATPPRPDESLHGYLEELAAHNGLSNSRNMLAALGMPGYGRRLSARLAELEALLGLTAGALTALVPSDRPSLPIARWQFQRRGVDPVCPGCLTEAGYRRRAWDHALILACPRHGRRLLDTCPACGGAVSLADGSPTHCICGYPWSAADTAPATERELAVSAALANTAHTARSGLPRPLDTTTPPDLDRLVYFLAAHAPANATAAKPRKAPLPATIAAGAAFLEPAFVQLHPWPDGFDAEVRRRLAGADDPAIGIAGRLGYWYQVLKRLDGDAYGAIFERLRTVVGEDFDGSYFGATGPSDGARWISAREAARRLHVRDERVVAAVRDGALAGRVEHTGFGHAHTVVKAAQIASIGAEARRFGDTAVAAERLGLPRRLFEHAVEAGVVRRTPAVELPAFAPGPFELATVERLASRMLAAPRRRSDGATVVLAELSLRRTTDRRRFHEFLRGIFNGDVAPVAGDQVTVVGELRYAVSDVRRYLPRDDPNRVSIQDLARASGWKHDVIRGWLRQELIAGAAPASRGRAHEIALADVVAFQSAYVPIATLAAALSLSPRALKERLEAAGVELCGAIDAGAGLQRGYLVPIASLARVALATE